MIISSWDEYNDKDAELWKSWSNLDERLAQGVEDINDWRRMGILGQYAKALDFVWRVWNCKNESTFSECGDDLQEQIDSNWEFAKNYLDSFINFCETTRFEDYRCRNLQEKYCDFLTGYRTFLKRLENNL